MRLIRCSFAALISIFIASGLYITNVRADGPGSMATNADIVVYIAPDGDDNRTGKSPADALRSLQRLQTMLKNGDLKITGNLLHVKFVSGTYYRMGVNWDYFEPDHTIVFEPYSPLPGSFPVVFDGTGDPLGQLFLLRITTTNSKSVNTGIVIRGFHITNYCEGISLGDWKSQVNITGNLIEGNKFSQIGSKYEQPKLQSDGRSLPGGRCVAGIRIHNASNNIIRNNVFTQIENLPASKTAARKYGPTLLHSIYLSNKSSDNRIEKNLFSKFTGSPIRIRAGSNNNVIVDNEFNEPIYSLQHKEKYRISAVSQWYCNDAVDICHDRAKDGITECPSTGINIIANKVGLGLDLYADDSQSKHSTCANTFSGTQLAPNIKDNAIFGVISK